MSINVSNSVRRYCSDSDRQRNLISRATTLIANFSGPITKPQAPVALVLSNRFWWFAWKILFVIPNTLKYFTFENILLQNKWSKSLNSLEVNTTQKCSKSFWKRWKMTFTHYFYHNILNINNSWMRLLVSMFSNTPFSFLQTHTQHTSSFTKSESGVLIRFSK